MTPEQLETLKKFVAKPKLDAKIVKITCTDGDVLEGFVEFVDEEYRDVIFQPLRSNNPEKYKIQNTYTVHWDDIESLQELTH